MTNPVRNSFIINQAFRKFFVASILISVIKMFDTLVDGIIVSHTVGIDAISVINMSIPIFSLIMLITSIIYTGASLVMACEIGNQNYKQVNRLFTMGLSSVFIINSALAIVLCSYTDVISQLFTSEDRLLSLLNPYLSISFIGNIIFAVLISLAQFIKINGQPGLATRAMIVGTFGNIGLDLVFVVVLDMGIQGAAWASAGSYLLAILVFIPYLRSEHRPFRLVSLGGGWYGALFGESLRRGFPIAIGIIMMAVLIMGLNAIVLKNKGANGLFVLSVCLQMQTLSLFISKGAGSAITGVGGVLLGEKDYEGAHLLVSKIFKMICVGMVALSAIVIAFPSLPARLFGVDGELLLMSEEALRIFSFIFIPIGVITLFSNLFMILNRNTMSSMINIGMVACMLPLAWLVSRFAPEYLWYSMPAGVWLLLIVTMAATWIISRRTKGLHWLYLMETTAHQHWITYSVNYETKDVERKLGELLGFLERYKLPRKLHLNLYHCLEELMYNEVEMARLTQKNGTFDISVNNQEDKLSIIIKDVGKPYNPIVKYIPNHIDDVDESQLSMLLVNGLCENINYKYMNGVNCLYLNFEKK